MAQHIPLEVTVELVLASLLRISHPDLRRYAQEGVDTSPISALGVRWGPRDPRQQDRRFADVPIRHDFTPDSSAPTTLTPTEDVHVQGSLDTVDTQMTSIVQDSMPLREGEGTVTGADSLLSTLSTMKEEKEEKAREEGESAMGEEEGESTMPMGMLTSATFLRLLEAGSPSSPDWCALMGRLLSYLPEDNEEIRDQFISWALEDVGGRKEGLLAWLYAEYGKEGYTHWQVRSLERLLPLCLRDTPKKSTLEDKENGVNVLQRILNPEQKEGAKEEEEKGKEDEKWGPECGAWVNLLTDLPEVDISHALVFVSTLLGLKSPAPEKESEEGMNENQVVPSSPKLGIHSIETLLTSRADHILRTALLSLLLPITIHPEMLRGSALEGKREGEEKEEGEHAETLQNGDTISLACLSVLTRTVRNWIGRGSCSSLLQEVRSFAIQSLTELTQTTLSVHEEEEGKKEGEDVEMMDQEANEETKKEKAEEEEGEGMDDKLPKDDHSAPANTMTLAEMRRRIWLFLALTREDLNLLPIYFDLYVGAAEEVKRLMRTEIRPLVPCLLRPPSGSGEEGAGVDERIIGLITDFPKGSDLLVLRFLILLTEGKKLMDILGGAVF
ncbi:hypothetical protein BJ684DRAFT_22209 [Piptocephalis cylindrospora]|uniref:Uncharacterized protein n=1 Tax=Piptocephalis cylindrospora TaxID=1907219 RepID=A0A4P9Y0E4_9FUNG|nr:hypothetical protein BJ684DRAFT_22209 [Piptocephalis cylindrospora]|eukprot:RKP11240.1 hypothetical protein BJ684DRAFT_22209 [Piptocephalis cylindrospora]